nr:MAG TPA: hypothetical protein [Caudoviricetes sp.]
MFQRVVCDGKRSLLGSDTTGLGKGTCGAGRMITTEELARIRSAAVGDMLGDSKALDEMGPSAVIFRLCRELERLEREADWLAHGYTNAVDLLGMCPRNVDMSKCQDSSCMECMRESARKAVEKK